VDFTQRFRANHNIIFREEAEGGFLFDVETANLKYMNQSAKDAFLMLNGQMDVNQVINQLLALHPDVDREQIEKNVKSFVLELVGNRFISPCEGE